MRLRIAAAAAGWLAAAAWFSACTPAKPAGPDRVVVLVLVDTLRADALSSHGAKRPTPAADALASTGVVFEHAIASSGWTLPSAVSLLTGVSPPVHHARGKHTRLTPVSPDVSTLGELLSEAGVHTIAITNAAFMNPMLGITRGFSEQSHHHAYNDRIRRADVTVDLALEALAEHEGRDTFALVHLFDAHLDYDPPEGYEHVYAGPPLRYLDCTRVPPGETGEPPSPAWQREVRAAYAAEVQFVDDQVGRLVEGLRRLGLLERTTLILTSDHGEEFWEHGGFEHGHSLYDELIHVPLIVRPPPHAGIEPRRIESQVRLIDVMPTVLEIFGVAVPTDIEGRSLLPLLEGEEDDAPRVALSTGTLYGTERVALRTERFKLLAARNGSTLEDVELYDWRKDPGEENDLSKDRPALLERMLAETRSRLAALEERGSRNRRGRIENLDPRKEEAYLRRLRSLGYLADE